MKFSRFCRCKTLLWLICSTISYSSFGEKLYECQADGVKSFQDKPCHNAGAEQNRHKIQQRKGYEAIYQKLEYLAYQGYGLSQHRKVKPRSKPSKYVKHMCGEPRLLQNTKAYRRCSATAIQELTKRKNTQSSAHLSGFYEEVKQICGAKWEQLPYVGMTDEDFKVCGRRGRIQQEILIDEGGVFAALYVLTGKRNNRVYSIDGVITKISTSMKNRSFR
jgi:5'(3')-deoxyribonucleotidase